MNRKAFLHSETLWQHHLGRLSYPIYTKHGKLIGLVKVKIETEEEL